ncbi:HPr kinase/phosphorylase [Pseudothioclava arenosa]|uniref:Serine kinase n=1 Tax=Pseudothioclava arenosa TaxID=1795308 RepID=A0A2A4CQR3_9RHOB|nr:HPr kinase/phosphatase C-terminal domain-containing protein [Pseudothioclava arenosa]PCD76479.1 serine kinase [Pseudothioclava arenosa]
MSGAEATAPLNIHASAVALNPDCGVLILGPSGAGKSALALELMAFGARLVADDRVDLHVLEGGLMASGPTAIAGQIEARGIGILAAEALPSAQIVLAVDLSQEETERLPPARQIEIGGVVIPLVLRLRSGHAAAGILQYLKAGRVA